MTTKKWFLILFVVCAMITGIVLLAIYIKPSSNKAQENQEKEEQTQTIENKQRDFNPNDTPKPQTRSLIQNDFSVLEKWKSYTRPQQVHDLSMYKRNLSKLELPNNVEEIICKPDLYPGSFGWNEKFPKHDTIRMFRDSEVYYILNDTQKLAFTRNGNVINTFTL